MEELGYILKVGHTTRQDDTCAKALAIACLANLRPHILNDVGHTGLDNGCQVQAGNGLDGTTLRAHHLDDVVGRKLHNCRTALTLQVLDSLRGDILVVCQNIGVDG